MVCGHHQFTPDPADSLSGVNAAGALVGSLANAYLADKFSRKYTIQIGAATLIVGAALCAASINVAMFMVARIIAGVGIGKFPCATCPGLAMQ